MLYFLLALALFIPLPLYSCRCNEVAVTEAVKYSDIVVKGQVLDEKNGIFRDDSMRAYKSQIRILTEWLKLKKRDNLSVAAFSKEFAQEYMDYVYQTRQVSPRTWNNYLSFVQSLWNWLIEKNYCSENPFGKIKSKPKTEKEYSIILPEWNKKIIEYFKEKYPPMELVCGLIYNSFMRPLEICRTQIKDVKIAQGAIYLQGSKAKNGKTRWCLLPPHLIELLIKMRIDKYPQDYYLVTADLTPGPKQTNTRKIDKYWDKMREETNIPKKVQLYWYRHTGITDLKKASYSNLFISSITGHLNSDEIETYTHAPDPKALQYIVEQSKKL